MSIKTKLEHDRHRLENFDWTGWSDWASWTHLDATDFADLPEKPGAYVIATNRPINRAIGTDAEGFLDVGESGKGKATVQNRLCEFRKCINNRLYEKHSAGWRFAYFYFARHFPLSSLRVRWIGAETKAEAHRYEGRILLTYLYRHAELPPLNYQFNWEGFKDFEGDVIERCLGRCD